MAHIFRKGKQQWQARYVGPDGRRHSKTFARKVDAERFLATAETAKLQGEWTDPRLGRTPFGEWVEEWRTGTVHLKPKTVEGYDSLLRCHLLPRFGAVALAAVTTAQLKAWIADLVAGGLGASRVRNAYRLMALIMQAAVDSGYLARSPCRGIKLPPLPKKEMRVLTARQVDDLAYVIAPPYAVLVYVLAYGGLRWGEACALRRRRCHLDRSRVWIAESLSEVNGQLIFGPTKTYAERWVRLPRFVAGMLRAHLKKFVPEEPDALVFTSCRGEALRGPNFRRRVWAPALKAAGLPPGTRLHDYADLRVMPTSANDVLQIGLIAAPGSA